MRRDMPAFIGHDGSRHRGFLRLRDPGRNTAQYLGSGAGRIQVHGLRKGWQRSSPRMPDRVGHHHPDRLAICPSNEIDIATRR